MLPNAVTRHRLQDLGGMPESSHTPFTQYTHGRMILSEILGGLICIYITVLL